MYHRPYLLWPPVIGHTLIDPLIAGNHSKYDQMLFVKIGKYIGFCVYRRSYLLWSPVIALQQRRVVRYGFSSTRTSDLECAGPARRRLIALYGLSRHNRGCLQYLEAIYAMTAL